VTEIFYGMVGQGRVLWSLTSLGDVSLAEVQPVKPAVLNLK